MRKIQAILCLFICSLELCLAQSSKEAIKRDPFKAHGLYYVYDYQSLPETTAAPEGYSPFYVSHFGRHGARYCEKEYDSLAVWLTRASRMGMLTDYGKEFHSRFREFYSKVQNCKGNLTDIGKEQQRSIAANVYRRFPEVFDGPTHVEAFSTESPRVISSMWSFLSTLQSLDPGLEISADASSKYAFWLQPLLSSNPFIIKGRPRYNKESDDACTQYFESVVPWREIAGRFFIGPEVIRDVLKTSPEGFCKNLHAFISDTYCLTENQGCFDDLLSSEEMYSIWKSLSARNFLLLANYEGSDNITMDYSAFMLENIIQNADEDIFSGRAQLRLRFGHDSGVMPLLAFMNVNGFGRMASTFDEGIDIFPNYNIPMGASVQFIFYRNSTLDNVLVKVLLNEEEVSLPFAPVEGPYYSWEDFKAFYNPLIAASKEKIEKVRADYVREKSNEASDPEIALDILRRADWNWQAIKDSDVQIGKASVRVFGTIQNISIVRFPTNRHSVSVVESDGESADITSRIGAMNNAIAAMNGSFFNTRSLLPVTYVKDNGNVVCATTVDGTTRCNGMFRIRGKRARTVDIVSVDSTSAPKTARGWREAIVAGPVLMEDGKRIEYVSEDTGESGDIVLSPDIYRRFYARRHPRSLVGYTSGGWVYFVVVDGRFKAIADGMSIPELQILSESLGLHEAINLDGGGSSALWSRDSGILNHPCDNKRYDTEGERRVPNFLIVR